MGLCPKPQDFLESQLKAGEQLGFKTFRVTVLSHAHFYELST